MTKRRKTEPVAQERLGDEDAPVTDALEDAAPDYPNNGNTVSWSPSDDKSVDREEQGPA